MYTNEKHAQIVLSLLKAHGVRKIVVSPGSTNIPISGSVQNDPFFEVYSSVDERSAAYIACGLAEKTGEIVAISCTGATASRNYLSGMTEAFYRKLPVVAITSFNGNEYIGNLVPQNIDRTAIQKDVALLSVQLPVVTSETDEWYCNTLVNRALLATRSGAGGPVHINLSSTYTGVFDVLELPPQRVIALLAYDRPLPSMKSNKIAIFIGSHRPFLTEETAAIDRFCESRNAVVICDHTSSYSGRFRVQAALLSSNYGQLNPIWKELRPEIVVHIGEVSGDYFSARILGEANEVWRVSEDGEVKDTGKKLKYVYHGSERSFFESMGDGEDVNSFYRIWLSCDEKLRNSIPELPFSNVWIASKLSRVLTGSCNLYLGILNSLRSWNFFNVADSVNISCNVGGFGIDGCLSTMLGASLADKNKLCFVVLGDLAFFYDINSLANRHLGGNVRVVLINNGCGVEFNNSSHIASRLAVDANQYIAAGGHFNSGSGGGSAVLDAEERGSRSLAKSWCEALGFKYLSALSKAEFEENAVAMLDAGERSPMILECFTNVQDESDALEIITNLDKSILEKMAGKAKKVLPAGVAGKAKKFMTNK